MELATRVEVSEDRAFTAAFHERQKVRLTIHLKDGKTLHGHCEITKGESANPHSAEDIQKKFYQLAHPVWVNRLHVPCMNYACELRQSATCERPPRISRYDR